MKIYLYLSNQVKIFYLPEIVSGSYSFDMDENEVDKLINVNSKDGKWILSSTDVSFPIVSKKSCTTFKFVILSLILLNVFILLCIDKL